MWTKGKQLNNLKKGREKKELVLAFFEKTGAPRLGVLIEADRFRLKCSAKLKNPSNVDIYVRHCYTNKKKD